MVRFLDLYHSHEPLMPELLSVFERTVHDSSFIGGAPVSDFEHAFAEFVGAAHCVGVANGTDAIEIALEALAPQPGAEVIVPANSFIATSEAVTRAGFNVVFADIDLSTMNIDLDHVRSLISPRTAGVIAVHLYGNPADVIGLRALCDERSLFLIEDCAQAHGATLDGRHVGTFGHISTFSFYPGKNLGALGDAGAIVTNDDALARQCRMIANHGRLSKYDHLFEGRNSRIDALQAALLTVKLGHLEGWVARRRAVADRYDASLNQRCVGLLARNPRGEHAFHLYVVRTTERERLMAHLTDHGVETGVHYPIALPALRAYSNHPQRDHAFRATSVAGELLSLPMGPHLDDEDIDTVVNAVNAFTPAS